jgi:8-oxo-dGTP diphosphatase
MDRQPETSRNIYPDRPRAAVGAIVFKEGHVLLIRRGKFPAKDQWAIPGGSIELGETLQEAAEREVWEETAVVIRAGEPFFTFNTIIHDEVDRVRYHYVIVDLLAEYVSGKLKAGDDAADARWVGPREIEDLNINPVTYRLLRQDLGFE